MFLGFGSGREALSSLDYVDFEGEHAPTHVLEVTCLFRGVAKSSSSLLVLSVKRRTVGNLRHGIWGNRQL
jgi:hypothetical protein